MKKNIFKDSLDNLRKVNSLAIMAMLLALNVILGYFTLQLGDLVKIGYSFIAVELSSMFFGPTSGMIVGGLGDLLKYIIKPTGPFFPGFTISAIAGGLIYGLILYKKPVTLKRIALANGLNCFFVNMVLNTVWLAMLYNQAYIAMVPARFLKQIIMYPIEVIMFFVVYKVLYKSKFISLVKNK
ncbi:MAG: folate family ECF transporter S component [Lachnospiraceae bacterium]|nr:folate family ECF transporter S component [Lachnospiraceae bacterium]